MPKVPAGNGSAGQISRFLMPRILGSTGIFENPSMPKAPLTSRDKGISYQHGKYALITGATSGIGKAFAFEFAREGYNLIITGRRNAEINRFAAELRIKYRIRVDVFIGDLAVKKDMNGLLDLAENKKPIEILVNNAGFGLAEKFSTDRVNNQLKMLDVHVTAPLRLIHKVAPQMISRKSGTIINVTSMAAFIPTSDNAMYSGTKSFLTSFTESLFLELHQYGIRVQCLCPGFTQTNFHAKLDKSKLAVPVPWLKWMEPSEVVNYSLLGLKRDEIICIPGSSNRAILGLLSFMPRRLYYYLMNRAYN